MNDPRTPALYSYLKKYQENPDSRVFAPLAEAYRKAGLIDEAIQIAREGVEKHPLFVGGRVALARALFEKKDYKTVTKELENVVREAPDNLVAQRLYAEASLMLGRMREALDAYKMYLYFNPSDRETANLVWELETRSYQEGAVLIQGDEETNAPTEISEDQKKQKEWMTKVELLQAMLMRLTSPTR